MDNIVEQIAKLPPEKRDLLLKKLKQHQDKQAEANPLSSATTGDIMPFDPIRDANFNLQIPTFGLLDTLTYKVVPRVPPGPGQVEIEILASSLNFGDVVYALGLYPMPAVMGSDGAGRIARVGEGVEGFKVGDEVMAMTVDVCGYSRYSTIAAAAVVQKPAYLTFEEAATIPTVFITIYYGLDTLASLAKGQRILIHSATGGVGLAAIQYAESVGAEVLATAGTEEKREYLCSLGVKHIFNSRSLDFTGEVMEATAGEGVDVVLNSIAGEAIPKSFLLLRPLGKFIELGRRDFFQNSPLGMGHFYYGVSFHGVSLGFLLIQRPDLFKRIFLDIMERFDKKIFKLLPIRVYPATEITRAYEFMAQGTHIGKLAVKFTDQQIRVTP